MSLVWFDYRKKFSLIIWCSGLSHSVLCMSDRFCIYLCRELNGLFWRLEINIWILFILSHIWFFAYCSLVTASSRWIFDQNSRGIERKVELLTHSLRSLVRRTRFARSHRLDCNNYLGSHFLKGGTIIFIIFWISHFGVLIFY